MSLREELIKLAHRVPETRAHLLPLLQRYGQGNPFHVGDILNGVGVPGDAVFYQVVGVTLKGVTLRPIAARFLGKEIPAYVDSSILVEPIPNHFLGPAVKKPVTKWYGRKIVVRIDNQQVGDKWAGKPILVSKNQAGVIHKGKQAAPRSPFSLSRRQYLPPEVRNQPPVTPAGTDLEIWSWEDAKGKPNAIAFAGRSEKPLWFYSFRDDAQRQRQIDQTIRDRQAWLKRKQDSLEERRNFQHGLKEGDIFYSSWGYDQTNVDFYQVVAVAGKSVTIREIASKVVSDRGPVEMVVAVPDRFIGPAMRKIPQKSGSQAYIKLNSYSSARLWDGKPKQRTGAGWGH